MPTPEPTAAATTVPWDTIRRLRAHLESEQRHARVRHRDGTSYPTGTPRWVLVVWSLVRSLNRWIEPYG